MAAGNFFTPAVRALAIIGRMKSKISFVFALLAALALGPSAAANAQSVTTGSIGGIVTDGNKPVAGASVLAIHEPAGTSYEATTRADGRFSIPNMRIGGPYTVTVNYVGSGTAFAPKNVQDLTVNLGVTTDVNVNVQAIAVSESVTVTGQTDPVLSLDRTGAAETPVSPALSL